MAAEIEGKIRSEAGLLQVEALTGDEVLMADGQDDAPEEAAV